MKNKDKTLIGTSILASIAASICCITPVLALIAGTGSFASSFKWLEPLRPYLIGITVIVLAYAWYDKLRPRKEIECDCETDEKPSFWKSKSFLAIITVFSVLALSFPYYSQVFYPKKLTPVEIQNTNTVKVITMDVKGMTCTACNFAVKNAALDVPGVISADADFKTGTAIVRFDTTVADISEIIDAINKTEYEVEDIEK